MKRLTILLLITLPFLFSCTEKEHEPQVIPVESVSINQTTASITIGETLQLNASVSPSTATNKEVTWSSSNQSVASVSSSGLVTAVGEGTATISASAGGKKGECSVSVAKNAIAVSEVKLDKAELTLYEGEEEALTATVLPDDASDKTITWNSSDKSIATVESGKVKAVGKGTAKITATSGANSASCEVTVLRPVSGISLDKTQLELALEKSETLVASIIPEDATAKEEITWSSSDPKVASVEDGKIAALTVGSATITASLDGYKAECNVVVKGMEYEKIAITDLKPVEILPVIGQVEVGDKQCYDHIEHLRLAEATRIRDMMWEYGAGSHSKEEYQQLMGRLVVGMSNECPSFSESFEVVGRGFTDLSTWENGHSQGEWSILNSIVPNTRRIIELNGFYDGDHNSYYTEKPEQIDWINMESFLAAHSNSIVILARSSDSEGYNGFRDSQERVNIREFCRSGRLILIKSGGNVDHLDEVLINKCFHKDVKTDEQGLYSTQSMANGKNDVEADMALLVTIGTNDKGNSDQTGVTYSSSCFPVGFHDQVLFAGRAFPFQHYGQIWAEKESVHSYQTSFVNYVNAAMMSVCFQMYAEAKDVFELLDMVRSTCLTDYIRLDGMTQPLQLINPAGLYKKYLTPQNLPETISNSEILALDKGYYKGVIFSIPGAEVKVGGEWVAFDNKNKSTILALNPMNLEWRLNGGLLRKMGYTSGQTIEGQILTVDDKWGGLRLEVPISVVIK